MKFEKTIEPAVTETRVIEITPAKKEFTIRLNEEEVIHFAAIFALRRYEDSEDSAVDEQALYDALEKFVLETNGNRLTKLHESSSYARERERNRALIRAGFYK